MNWPLNMKWGMGAVMVAYEEENNQWEHQEFELVHLLTACVEAIGSKNMGAINHFIAKLGDQGFELLQGEVPCLLY
ncbi:hypothetical protein V6N13_036344 [Hibiscus sabdariffa]|uniref:Clp R domain-containing protein n=1 Tax=Hibiscus sabdariffa TaxID=183260 RepID=A0ABR2S7E6_9ROSI